MDVNLSCIDLSVEDLLRCSFGLSKQEVRVLVRLLEEPAWADVVKISSRLHRDRSVVQRGLQSLLRKGLVERDQRNKAGGGYEYLYRAKDKRMMKASILAKSRTFSAMVSEAVRGW